MALNLARNDSSDKRANFSLLSLSSFDMKSINISLRKAIYGGWRAEESQLNYFARSRARILSVPIYAHSPASLNPSLLSIFFRGRQRGRGILGSERERAIAKNKYVISFIEQIIYLL